jgi:hypothetical protein
LVGFGAAVGRDGTVYAIWQDGQAIVLAISRDGGRSFEPSRRVVSITPPLFPNIADFPGANGLPTIAIDPRTAPGRLVVSWGDSRSGDLDILSAVSEDGGRTWTDPVRVNDDPLHDGKDQILSWMTVDPTDGSIYALFYDRRGDSANVLPSITLARSTDGGRHYRNYAWTASRPDPKRAHFGDYLGMAALDGRVYGAWVEDERQSGRPALSARIGATRRALGASVIRIGGADFRDSVSARP